KKRKIWKYKDYEIIIEGFLLPSAHFVNASMHKLETLKQDRDIKHNQLFGFLKREIALGDHSSEVAELIQKLEQLRPSHVYGKGSNGDVAKKAEETFNKIKIICQEILEEKKENWDK
ncbi:hypothetical protein HYT51_00290, partial [Candidatus Woesearchaeota archaeon]|nr:hypothetical protein [Candidatus Woesearchaeota archaeon]